MQGLPPDGYFITDKYSSARRCQSPPAVRRSKKPSALVSLRLFLEARAQPNATSNILAHVNSPPEIGNDVFFCQRYNSHGGKETIPARNSSSVRRPVRPQPSEKIFPSTPAAMPRHTAHWDPREQFGEQSAAGRACPSNKKRQTSANARTKRHTHTHKSCPTMTWSSAALLFPLDLPVDVGGDGDHEPERLLPRCHGGRRHLAS